MKGYQVPRLLAYVTGPVNQELLLRGTDFVSLQAELETGQYSGYQAQLRSLRRKELVWKRSSLKSPGIGTAAATLQPGTS